MIHVISIIIEILVEVQLNKAHKILFYAAWWTAHASVNNYYRIICISLVLDVKICPAEVQTEAYCDCKKLECYQNRVV